jgi:hypothetical protein
LDNPFAGEGAAGWEDYGFGQATIADGVKLIAGGMENMLQRFRMQVLLNNPERATGAHCFASTHVALL